MMRIFFSPAVFIAGIAVLLFAGHDALAVQRPGGMPGAIYGPPGGGMGGKIEGKVVDGKSSEAIPSSTVSLWVPADSSMVTGVITNADGEFEMERIPPGTYYLRVSFVGYATEIVDDITVSREEPAVQLGMVRLYGTAAQLDGVEVMAERDAVQFGVDRTLYNVRDQPASSGGNAIDVLENIPSIEVDIEGRVSLRGNQNVSIHINGRPSPVRGDFLSGFLRQISSDMIERIEVIPNPSARDDPEGMAGIINIVLRDDSDLGTSGGITLGLGSGDKYNASGNIAFQRGRMTLSGNYGYRNERRGSTGFNFRESHSVSPQTFLEQDIRGANTNESHLVNLSADYRLDRNNTLSTSGMLSLRDGTTSGTNAYYWMTGPSRALDNRYDRINEGDPAGSNINYTLAYIRKLAGEGHELSAEARYNLTWNDNFRLFTERHFEADGTAFDEPELQKNDLDTRNNELDFQIDYERAVGAGTRVELGYKGSLRAIDNSFFSATYDHGLESYLPDEDRNNEFVFDEHVHGAYSMINQSLGRFAVQGGVRLEQALTTFDLTTTGDSFDNNYFSIFPSLAATYQLSEGNQLRASYSKRITRPHTGMLNPFTPSDDPLNLFVGNPFLQPEYVHAFEVGYQKFTNWGSLSFAPFYRHTVDAFGRYRTVDSEGISTVTFENMDSRTSYGVELITSLRVSQRFNGFLSFNGNRVVSDAGNLEANLGSQAFAWSARGNVAVNITRNLDLQMFYFYRAPMDVEQGRISSFSMANVALRQRVLGNQGSVSLRLSDPLNTMGFNFETRDDLFVQESSRKWESRVAFLTFQYNFGRPQRQQQRPRGPEADGGVDMNDIGIQ